MEAYFESGSSSVAVTPTRARKMLEMEFDPSSTSREAYNKKLLKLAQILEDEGNPLTDFEMKKLGRRTA